MATSPGRGRRARRAQPELARPARVRAAHHPLARPTASCTRASAPATIGDVVLARARYGWAGPVVGPLVLRAGRRVALRPRRLQPHEPVRLHGLRPPRSRRSSGRRSRSASSRASRWTSQADDNAHVLLDFGQSRFASIACGFTMQKYRSPAIELYGTEGVLQMLGDDWAPEGFEQWLNSRGVWEVSPERRARLAVDGRPPAPRRVRRGGPRRPSPGRSTPTTRSRSCSRPSARPPRAA